jgi:hypothetical protein
MSAVNFGPHRCDLKDSRKNSVMEVKKADEEDVVLTADEGQESGLLNILTQPSCQVTTIIIFNCEILFFCEKGYFIASCCTTIT